ncbi:unnamed protein product [Polarella glacialis]|uniref:Uncharacterized protein n=1 Tax=Polarella glacialis TaxID=89957 RepID=A0A813LP09_POLGL|nr:unnamed protein product [Polarella glacialis]
MYRAFFNVQNAFQSFLKSVTEATSGLQKKRLCCLALLVAEASCDRTARIYNARTGCIVQPLTGHGSSVRSAVFGPLSGRDSGGPPTRVLTASDDLTARIWSCPNGSCLLHLLGHSGRVNCATFSPDGCVVVTASQDMTLKLWDTSTGDLLRTLDGGEEPFVTAAFSPDGFLFSGKSK